MTPTPDDPSSRKRTARGAAAAAREAAQAEGAGAARRAAAHALAIIAGLRQIVTVAGYLPIRRELDPRPAMLGLIGCGFRVCVPVIESAGLPLRFRAWTPEARLVRGAFGVTVPAEGAELEPDVLLVPLLAFDPECHRLGYGGGFYDRTIAALRARREVVAYGFAFAAQRVDALPRAATDVALDAVITEHGVLTPALAGVPVPD